MKNFLEGLEPLNTFICFTHCDSESAKKNDDLYKQKLKSLYKYTQLEIPEENIIKFDKTIKPLKDFVANMVEGEIFIPEDIEERLEDFDEEMPRVAKVVD